MKETAHQKRNAKYFSKLKFIKETKEIILFNENELLVKNVKDGKFVCFCPNCKSIVSTLDYVSHYYVCRCGYKVKKSEENC